MHKKIEYPLSTNQLTVGKLRVWIEALTREGVPPDAPILFDLDKCLILTHDLVVMSEE